MEKESRIIQFEKDKLYGPKLTKDITENDYFIDCYKKAAKQTIEIVTYNTKETYKIKNIIAFLGNRGQGKTSMMRSYIHALTNKNRLLFQDKLKDYNFITLDTIDPSTFEDCSNILDIILGQLLDLLQKQINLISRDRFSKDSEDSNSLIEMFGDLYNQYMIIKDKNLLKRNYEIYDGSIDSLITINDISRFKHNLSNLIQKILIAIGQKEMNNVLIISVDDIDIDLSHCYETIDTIRKYLNLPNVLIVLAAKLEQLHEGIRMEHMRQLKTQSSIDSNKTYEDVYNMATKYLLKILPQNRRIHIPDLINNIWSLQYDIKIEVDGNQKSVQSLFSNLLYDKTGIIVLDNNMVHNYLLNGNLRSMVDLYSCLDDMDSPNNDFIASASIYLKNLEKFKDYFLNNWCTNNLSYTSARLIRKLYNNGSFYKNHALIQMLIELVNKDEDARKKIGEKLRLRRKKELLYDLSDVSYYLNKIENHVFNIEVDDASKFVYSIKMCYTIIMNQLRFTDNLNYDSSPLYNKNKVRESGHLLKFVGGRILIENVLITDKAIRNKKDKRDSIIDKLSDKIYKYVNEQFQIINNENTEEKNNNDNQSNDKNVYLILGLLLSITSKDKERDIYYYNHGNTQHPFYFDPLLFFVNSLDLQFTSLYLYNRKITMNNSDSIISLDFLQNNDDLIEECIQALKEIDKYRSELEYVARSIVCNFNVYDFLIDHLDVNYMIKDNFFRLSELYGTINHWLQRLGKDLDKQFGEDSNIQKLNSAIKNVYKLINNLSQNFNDSDFEINGINDRIGFQQDGDDK